MLRNFVFGCFRFFSVQNQVPQPWSFFSRDLNNIKIFHNEEKYFSINFWANKVSKQAYNSSIRLNINPENLILSSKTSF